MSPKTWTQFWTALENSKSFSGGQGTVIKVSSITLEQIGALKQIHSSDLQNTERRRRMAREVSTLTKIQGQGIPEVLDHNIEHVEDLAVPLYLVMRWIDGQNLQQLAGGRPQSIEKALRITRYLAETLNRCHSAGIVHRDIKPENIIVEQQTRLPMLVDFGLSWGQAEDENTETLTSAGQELGNRFLRLPDLSAGQEKHDKRTDITFLVGILFFLLTGVAPRQLLDPRGLPPHEALADRFSETVLTDSRWHLLRRIFRVGFQPSIDLRFQNTTALIDRLDEILSPKEVERETVGYKEEAEAIRNIIQSAVFESMQQIVDALKSTSDKLMGRLLDMARQEGFHASIGGVNLTPGLSIHFYYNLQDRPDDAHATVSLSHWVELEGESKSTVNAAYSIAEQQKITYYRGPSADVERLEDELLMHAGEMFRIALVALQQQLKTLIS